MQIIKYLINRIIVILICVILFMLYIVIDRKYYKRNSSSESFEMNQDFNLRGNANDTNYAPIAYDDLTQSLKDLDNFPELSLLRDNYITTISNEYYEKGETKTQEEKKAEADKRLNRLKYTLKEDSNKKFFNLDAIKKDLKYFNNATHLKHANNMNTNEYNTDDPSLPSFIGT